jgi:hypothetical protein
MESEIKMDIKQARRKRKEREDERGVFRPAKGNTLKIPLTLYGEKLPHYVEIPQGVTLYKGIDGSKGTCPVAERNVHMWVSDKPTASHYDQRQMCRYNVNRPLRLLTMDPDNLVELKLDPTVQRLTEIAWGIDAKTKQNLECREVLDRIRTLDKEDQERLSDFIPAMETHSKEPCGRSSHRDIDHRIAKNICRALSRHSSLGNMHPSLDGVVSFERPSVVHSDNKFHSEVLLCEPFRKISLNPFFIWVYDPQTRKRESVLFSPSALPSLIKKVQELFQLEVPFVLQRWSTKEIITDNTGLFDNETLVILRM